MKTRIKTTLKRLSEQWLENTARYLDGTDQQRYRHLAQQSSLSKVEENDRRAMVRATEASRALDQRYKIRRPYIRKAAEHLLNEPGNTAAQRVLLRELITPCYPDYLALLTELSARGDYTLRVYPPARQALETVLHVMDHTLMVKEILLDPIQRVPFLAHLAAMLEPFRRAKAHRPERGKFPDLNQAFAFRAVSKGERTADRRMVDAEAWDTPCFDLNLLRLAGVKSTAATARAASVHAQEPNALRAAFKRWIAHPVRQEWLRRGDSYAQHLLADPHCQQYLATAFPALPKPPRAHRPANNQRNRAKR